MNIKLAYILLVSLTVLSCSSSTKKNEPLVLINTTAGDIKVKLYNETPVHRDNFIKLAELSAYDGLLFHRVINGFMIQGGDPETRDVKNNIGADTLADYTIPAEFNTKLYHKKGALAAARMGNDVNPDMRSSGTQFYIVQGKVLNDSDLVVSEDRINSLLKQARLFKIMSQYADSSISAGGKLTEAEIQEKAFLRISEETETAGRYIIPEDQKAVYKTVGGVPRLDGTYTVFGEVTEGLEIVDNIAATQTDSNDKPVSDIRIIKMKVIRK